MASTSSLLNFLSPLFPSSNTPSSSNPKFPLFTSNNPSTPISISNSNANSLSISSTPKKQQENAVLISSKKEEDYPSELIAVVCPSLAFSNTLYYKSAYNVQVLVDENEPEERLLNRFRREVMRAGVIQECKRRRFFENKQDEKKRKSREAAKRNSRRRRTQFRGPFQNREDAVKVEKKEDDEDNWEMPTGDDAPF